MKKKSCLGSMSHRKVGRVNRIKTSTVCPKSLLVVNITTLHLFDNMDIEEAINLSNCFVNTRIPLYYT